MGEWFFKLIDHEDPYGNGKTIKAGRAGAPY